MNLVVNYIFSAVNAFSFFLYMFEVGSVTTGGPLFLLKEHKNHIYPISKKPCSSDSVQAIRWEAEGRT